MYQFQAAKKKPAKKLSNVIAVDFDGVIHDNPLDKSMGEPINGCKESLEKLIDLGFTIVIYTLRGEHDQHVIDWLDFYNIPYHQVTNKKPDALAYIDDKAIRFNDWDSTMSTLHNYLLPFFGESTTSG